jgi:glycosyltransferase involved in cell wall biosynthesis
VKLSFVITAFNRPLALRTCLSSIIQQTVNDWEAVVVDNSDLYLARERHESICQMDDRVRYHYTGDETSVDDTMHMRSLYRATEVGVTITRGQYLSFPNDDSYYVPWFAERMLDAAIRNRWDLVYCDIVMGSAGGHWLLEAHPRLCRIDKTNFILKRERFHGFSDASGDAYPQADGAMIEQLVRDGVSHGRVPQILAVHN